MAKRKVKRRKAVAKKAPRRVRRTKRVVRAKRTPRVAGISHALSGLQNYRRQLLSERTELDSKIKAVDGALRAMGTGPGRGRAGPVKTARGPGRPRAGGVLRPGSLKAYLHKVLSGGGVMAVKDITAGVLKSGYKSKNKTLAKSVGIALTEMPRVAKVARGRFRLR